MSAPVIDANAVLAAQKSKLCAAGYKNLQRRSTQVELDGPQAATFDLALLAVFDSNPIRADDYSYDKEGTLASTARRGVQLLVNEIFNQPTRVTPDGVYATLPVIPSTVLPREKPLPKPKPETKWEKFAKTKGISPKQKRDRLVYDEEKQEFVPRWGYKGKNKAIEEQWIHEVPAGKDANFDPVAEATVARKQRKLKNDQQRVKNEQRAAEASLRQASRSKAPPKALPPGLAALESARASASKPVDSRTTDKQDIERLLRSTRTATASMGKFDKTLDKEETVIGKQGARGAKRKFEDNSVSAASERQKGMDILQHLDKVPHPASRASKRQKKTAPTTEKVVNSRKAIRFASKGQGAAALVGEKSPFSKKAGSGKSRKS